ncbi:pyridoxamine 5'-phosphate oxidase family protein [Streptomyces roseolilacinus]|uniref:Pyridoxamine 5'-phosphate oxidase n=1 Tax=Streptomyces roseolilacinus TaxID=66904 RepID=A0A918B5M6_9ACTN|nr:pyridoxamine 5'-phosphate oxidase family protein [Streptomyces roseolilacinus]GGQ28419.1 pyridoxamine 5'-phosphate oxidase [Streptomyces roseolilacinus]
MTVTVSGFSEIQDAFLAHVRDTEYATMITVDRRNRPRARVLLPVGEVIDGEPVGWLASYPAPVKSAHLAGNPHTTCAYWSPRQNAVFVDSVPTWAADEGSRVHAWEVYERGGPPGMGHDPSPYPPGGPGYHVLRIEPWRIRLVRGSDLRGTLRRKQEPAPAVSGPAGSRSSDKAAG